jgi:hypothetical protein
MLHVSPIPLTDPLSFLRFVEMNFSKIGLDEDNMDVPMDEAGQPLDSPRLIAKQGCA